jgi:glycosyltransferase involved in cell wall biosynthesis
VYTAHGFHFHPLGGRLRNRIFLMLERLAGRWTDALIVLNQEDYEAAREQGIVPADRLFRMPGIGLDLAYWARESVPPQAVADLRRELAVEEGARMLLCVAEMTARKRHADLLNGWARFVAASRGGNRLPPMLVLAGEGPLRRRLERQTARLGIGCWVRFVGFRDDLRPLYALADATLLISVQEGLPRSIMESLAMQTPVVASDIRGSHELVDASCGWLVPPRDPAGVADALRILAGLPEDARLQMGRNGRTKMQAFGLQRCLAETEDIYRQVLERRRA